MLSAVQPRREGFPLGYGECPCCHGAGWLPAYSVDFRTVSEHPCAHCQGSGQIKVECAPAPPAKTVKSFKSFKSFKSKKSAKRKGRKR